MKSRSRIFEAWLDEWRQMRADYELVHEAAYERAERATSGNMLNARGRLSKIDAYSLFIGPAVRANAYASAELIEHWQRYPRPTLESFERQWIENRQYERATA